MEIKFNNIDQLIVYITSFKSRDNIKLICSYCKKEYFKNKKDIQNLIRLKQTKSFCSASCFGLSISKKKIYNCQNCNKEVVRNNSQIKGKIFCSQSCSAKINNCKNITHNKCVMCNNKVKKNARLYCSIFCYKQYKYLSYIDRWKKGLEDGLRGDTQVSTYIRRWMKENYGEKCCKCGWAEINPHTNSIPIRLDHIDGNWKNNRPENFRFLCPNCDSLSSTYGSLDRGKGRPYFIQKGIKREISVNEKHD